MKKGIIFLMAGGLFNLVLLFSCKTAALPTCKNTISLPVVVQVDSNTFYTIQVPFCDTVLVTKKVKQ